MDGGNFSVAGQGKAENLRGGTRKGSKYPLNGRNTPSSFWRLPFKSNVFALQCNQADSRGGRNPIWGGWHKKLKTTRERLQQCVCTRSGQRNKVALNCSSFIQSRPHSFEPPLVVRTIAVYIISLLSLSQVEPTWLLLLVHLLFVFKVWPHNHQRT